LKLTTKYWKDYGWLLDKSLIRPLAIEVLPQPELPIKRVGWSTLMKYFINVYLENVSGVGTVTLVITYLVESNSIYGTSH